MFECKKCVFEDKGSNKVSTHNLKTLWKFNNGRFECKICGKIFSKATRNERDVHMPVICKKIIGYLPGDFARTHALSVEICFVAADKLVCL